jgi:transposase InsO family protein
MQRTLQADTTRLPGATRRAQPQQFTHVRAAFNHARPHEALDRRTPAACYASSPRAMPTTLSP